METLRKPETGPRLFPMERMREEAKELEKKLDESGESQISLTDPDSRMMPVSGDRRTDVCYNVQVCVEEKHKLIPDHEVITDRDLLSYMAKRVKDLHGVDDLEVLADMGYYHGKEIKAWIENGITSLVPKPRTSTSRKHGLFNKEDFHYDPGQDCYLCPAGETLTFRFQTTEKGRDIKYYTSSDCTQCPIKAQCTRSKDGRCITRWIDEDLLDAMERRLRRDPEKPVLSVVEGMKLRKRLAEHPFGTIKHHWDQGHFLTRKLPNVRVEMTLTILAYNFKRTIKILGVQKMVEVLA